MSARVAELPRKRGLEFSRKEVMVPALGCGNAVYTDWDGKMGVERGEQKGLEKG